MGWLQSMLRVLSGSARDLASIVAVIAFFQLVVLRQPFHGPGSDGGGPPAGRAGGSPSFVRGLDLGLFPFGQSLAQAFARKGSLGWLLAFAFALGFGTTAAEPALTAIANEASEVAAVAGAIADEDAARQRYALGLRFTVALAVGVAIVIGVWRILAGWPIHLMIAGGYLLVVVVTAFAPDQIIGIAYDSGGVTTSTITVPLVTALGVGLASSIEGRHPMGGRLRSDRLRVPHAHHLRDGLRDPDLMPAFWSCCSAWVRRCGTCSRSSPCWWRSRSSCSGGPCRTRSG